MKRLALILFCCLLPLTGWSQKAFVENLQQRDSILIADQLLYGAVLEKIPFGSSIMLPQVGDTLSKEILVVDKWRLDTLKTYKKDKLQDIRAALTITSFDEGEYVLPTFNCAVRRPDGSVDTLSFEGQDIFVCTMPVDTATFQIHDLKAQMRYPVTFRETIPWIGLALLLVAIGVGIWYLVRRRRMLSEQAQVQEPAHIVALRKLEHWRGDKNWEPSRQKAFYSGVTDTLREYIARRYGVGAKEMTTAELFNALKSSELSEDWRTELRGLFDRSDYVKFAKYIADDQENATVLPLAVRFVTDTYKADIEGENANVL